MYSGMITSNVQTQLYENNMNNKTNMNQVNCLAVLGNQHHNRDYNFVQMLVLTRNVLPFPAFFMNFLTSSSMSPSVTPFTASSSLTLDR